MSEGDADDDTGDTLGLETLARAAERSELARGSLPEGTRVGRYLILSCLGGGGGGLVYAAFDPELDRRVALKLLRPDGPDSGASLPGHSASDSSERSTAQVRLLREAQAMAKLAHPNVTTVHDVGTFGDQVFIAMELVDGGTLRDRLKARPPRAEVLRLLLDAGEGLAAAHDAGLVHRDFKPDNVLVGKDGRVRVTDFGLVRAVRLPDEYETVPSPTNPPSTSPLVPAAPSSSVDLGVPLTQLGAVMGTPPYMAPEQHDSRETDARTDQYSYAITLYEALYGERPFAGLSTQIAIKKRSRALPEPPSGSNVPLWQRRILERGLSPDPAQRYPSMRAMLAALRADPAARRRRQLAVAGAVLAAMAVAGASFAFAQRAHADRCAGAESLLGGAWDEPTRARMREAFGKAVKPSDVLLRTTERALDGYAAAWTSMRHEACESTRVREEQPESVLVLRTACLDSRLRELRALTGQLVAADRSMALKAPQAAEELTSLAPCADVAALTAVMAPPKDPAAFAQVQRAREDLAEARALIRLGRDVRATELATDALAQAEQAHYAPAEADARYIRGVTRGHTGDNDGAESDLLTSFARALASKNDETAVEAAMNLAQTENYAFARPAEGLKWTEVAHGVLDRTGNADEPRARLLQVEAWVHYEQGDGKRAVELAEEAERTAERVFGGADSVPLASFLNALGAAYDKAARYEDCKRTQERALHITGSQLGEDHPNYAASLGNVGQVDIELGDYESARPLLEKSVELYTRLRGPDHPNTAIVLASLADALAGLKRCDEALPRYEGAVAINDAKFGLDYPDTTHFLAGLGHCRSELGDAKGAMTALGRGIALTQKPDADPDQAAEVRFELAKVLVRSDPRSLRARALAAQAIASYEKAGATRRAQAVRDWVGQLPS